MTVNLQQIRYCYIVIPMILGKDFILHIGNNFRQRWRRLGGVDANLYIATSKLKIGLYIPTTRTKNNATFSTRSDNITKDSPNMMHKRYMHIRTK